MSDPAPSVAEVQDVPQRNRAQVLRDSVVIRLATNAAGPEIAEVLKENGIELPGVKWDNVFPHWLIATVDDEVIGCCQVAISKPVGYAEFLFVRKSVPFKLRAIAMRKLMIQAIATMDLAGCNYIASTVAVSNFKFANVIEKLNAVKMYQADRYAKRLS